jgi:hypothetical protein
MIGNLLYQDTAATFVQQGVHHHHHHQNASFVIATMLTTNTSTCGSYILAKWEILFGEIMKWQLAKVQLAKSEDIVQHK